MVGRPRTRNDLARVVRRRIDELKRTGLTQREIAERCRPPLEQYALSRIAGGGIHNPGPERLAALAVGLEMPLRELKAAVMRAGTLEPPVALPGPLPRASAIAMETAPILGEEQLRIMDAEFARVLQAAANSTSDRTR